MIDLNDLIAFLERHAEDHASPYSYQIHRRDHFDPDPRLDDVKPESDFVEVRGFSAGGHTLKATDANGRYLDGSLPTPPSQLIIGGQPVQNQLGSIREAIREEERSSARQDIEAEVERQVLARLEELAAIAVTPPEDHPSSSGESVEVRPRGRFGRLILGERR